MNWYEYELDYQDYNRGLGLGGEPKFTQDDEDSLERYLEMIAKRDQKNG